MSKPASNFSLEVEGTQARCPIGELIGNRNLAEGRIPVFSCEGACIRGEIARLAANLVATQEQYRRGCHGELFAVPHSAMARWAREAEKVVVIDGCFLHCHARIIKNIIGKEKVVQFDALSFHRQYSDLFDIDDVPEEERRQAARHVANGVLAHLEGGIPPSDRENEQVGSHAAEQTS